VGPDASLIKIPVVTGEFMVAITNCNAVGERTGKEDKRSAKFGFSRKI
jgi:hypothetical protein